MINLDNEKTNKHITNKIREHTKSFDLEELVNESRADIFLMDNAIRTLYFATVTGQNAILYGPGGYGKSRIIKYFYKKLGIPVFTKVCNSSTTVEDLLGIPDMNKLLNKSEYSIAFEKTIFRNKGILFLEEGLDMPPDVAASLKDVLTTKGYHKGDSIIESYISSVIIATNKDPKECALDDSTAAFYEDRFPHVLKIHWESHTYEDYYKFLTHSSKTKNFNEDIIKLLASIYEENKLSPRKVLDFSEVIKTMGIEYIVHISGLDTKSIKDMSIISEVKNSISEITTYFGKLKILIDTKYTNKYEKHLKLSELVETIKLLPCEEDIITLKESWIKRAELEINNLK